MHKDRIQISMFFNMNVGRSAERPYFATTGVVVLQKTSIISRIGFPPTFFTPKPHLTANNNLPEVKIGSTDVYCEKKDS
ncbi:hypothetical protein ES703_02404 [subsurface metagenome]